MPPRPQRRPPLPLPAAGGSPQLQPPRATKEARIIVSQAPSASNDASDCRNMQSEATTGSRSLTRQRRACARVMMISRVVFVAVSPPAPRSSVLLRLTLSLLPPPSAIASLLLRLLSSCLLVVRCLLPRGSLRSDTTLGGAAASSSSPPTTTLTGSKKESENKQARSSCSSLASVVGGGARATTAAARAQRRSRPPSPHNSNFVSLPPRRPLLFLRSF